MLDSLFAETFRDAAECLIKVDGEEITHLYAYVSDVTVNCSRREGCRANIKFETRRDETGEWLVQDDDALLPWKEIEIIAAFGSSYEEQVMVGYIQRVNASYPDQQCSAQVTVTCRDRSLILDREHVRDSLGTEDTPTSDTELMEDAIADASPLSLSGSSQSGQSSLIQVNRDGTNVEFMRSRARANGYELIFEGDEVYFGPMRLDEEAQPSIMVYAGEATNCNNFNVYYDGHQPDSVAYEVASREDDSTVEQEIVSDLDTMGSSGADSSAAGLGDYRARLTRPGAMSDEEMQAMATGYANEAAMKVRAQGQLDGSLYGHVLRVALPVVVDGVGTTYSGTYYVDSVVHRFNAEGYKQEFRLMRNAHGEDI